jgi:hypothetical protein
MRLHLFITACLAMLFSSCLKNKNFKTYTISRAEYSVKSEVTAAARLQAAEPLKNLGSFVLYGTTMYINEKDKGIHVVDYSNPTSPINKGFIPIPGNLGLAIKNNILYADCYCDLLAFKIVSNQDIQLQTALKGVFISRVQGFNEDTEHIKVTWTKKDTTVSSDYYDQYEGGIKTIDAASPQTLANNVPGGGGTSIGSSMAVFAIVNNYLYTVDNLNLHSFSLSDALNPKLENKQQVNWNVETIFPFKDKLFIGSMSGMFIYSIQNPTIPSYISRFDHVRVCDPVIADDQFAYVTLRNGSACGGFTNQLDVLNIENITNPVLVKSFPFSNPHGLSKDQNIMFVCDGGSGLKVVDASNPNDLVTKQSLNIGKAIDVVAYRNIAFVMLENAIQFYSYDQEFNVQLLSSLNKN